MYKLLVFTLSCSFLCLVLACGNAEENNETTENTETTTDSSTESNTETSEETPKTASTEAINVDDYLELDAEMPIGDYLGENVWITGTISKSPNQHMMKSSPPFGEEEKNLCIDYNDGRQTIVYYPASLAVPMDDQPHQYYGSIDKMTGAGKGGGAHTEYYINLVLVK